MNKSVQEGLSWKIGKVEIFQVVELNDAGSVIQGGIKEATPENIKKIDWLYPHFADENGNLKAEVSSFLIKSAGKNILIDTCNGNDKVRTDLPEWSNFHTDFLEKLRLTGVTEEDINFVLNTHLHCDHVGWNTKLDSSANRGVWKPTFPKAKYLFVKDEYDYWVKKPEKEVNDDKDAFDDSVAPVIKANLATFVDAKFKIDQYVSLVSTHGHTPGHVSVSIESNGEKAIISGDFLHHPCQIAYPEWSTQYDTFSDKANETRRRMLEEIAGTNTLLIGSHFSGPVAGFVKSAGKTFMFETVSNS